MSSINPHYTFTYSQPSEYRFSHDSVFLAREVFERVHAQMNAGWSALDLCSGCGIVGLDFVFHCRQNGVSPRQMDFVELQEEAYKDHFAENVMRLGHVETELRFQSASFADWPATNDIRYDLILSNPPYFREGSGKLSPSAFKNRCRFFVNGSQEELLACIRRSLKPDGQAFILMREVPAGATLAGKIRGTPLVHIRGNRSF